jgi:hypothetical protein
VRTRALATWITREANSHRSEHQLATRFRSADHSRNGQPQVVVGLAVSTYLADLGIRAYWVCRPRCTAALFPLPLLSPPLPPAAARGGWVEGPPPDSFIGASPEDNSRCLATLNDTSSSSSSLSLLYGLAFKPVLTAACSRCFGLDGVGKRAKQPLDQRQAIVFLPNAACPHG